MTAFRHAERERCRALRRAAGPESRSSIEANALRLVDALVQAKRSVVLGFYWPIQGEIGLFAAMRHACELGAVVALPVVVDRDAPLVFRRWTKATRMETGVWNIPVPEASAGEVDPHVLLVPVVGYDAQNFRLGNGGGYYDRTLAARVPRPKSVGIGITALRMESIRPQAHDLPMDVMLTEEAFDVGCVAKWFEDRIDCSSPPCAMPEEDVR